MIHYVTEETATFDETPGFRAIEYPLESSLANVAKIVFTSRYPHIGMTQNLKAEETVYVLEGSATFTCGEESILLSKGSALRVEPNKPYFWQPHPEVKLIVFSTPPWNKHQTTMVA